MDILWVRVGRSSHAVRGGGVTLCGRHFDPARVRDRLGTEKSCETCLRVIARSVDVPA